MSTFDRVLVEIVVAAPIDEVWRALRDPDALRQWFGWQYPGLEEEIAWIAAAQVPSGEGARREIRVPEMPDRYVVEGAGERHTIVRVIRSARVTDRSWRGIYEDTLEGWLMFNEQLRFMLERHPRDARRTLLLSGRRADETTPVPVEALGLSHLVVVPVGERYSATSAVGDVLEGQIWHRGPYQVGLTVDAFGDGLLIVSTRTVTDKSAYGGGALLLTTYGLDDRRFAALRERWSSWWTGRYDVIEVQPPA